MSHLDWENWQCPHCGRGNEKTALHCCGCGKEKENPPKKEVAEKKAE